jgi:hypothetical protein
MSSSSWTRRSPHRYEAFAAQLAAQPEGTNPPSCLPTGLGETFTELRRSPTIRSRKAGSNWPRWMKTCSEIFVQEGADILDHSDTLMANLRASPHDQMSAACSDLHTKGRRTHGRARADRRFEPRHGIAARHNQ